MVIHMCALPTPPATNANASFADSRVFPLSTAPSTAACNRKYAQPRIASIQEPPSPRTALRPDALGPAICTLSSSTAPINVPAQWQSTGQRQPPRPHQAERDDQFPKAGTPTSRAGRRATDAWSTQARHPAPRVLHPNTVHHPRESHRPLPCPLPVLARTGVAKPGSDERATLERIQSYLLADAG